MPEKVNVGVVGCGHWAPNPVRNFRSLAQCHHAVPALDQTNPPTVGANESQAREGAGARGSSPAAPSQPSATSDSSLTGAGHPGVQVIDPLLEPRWDEWVSSLPNASPFHRAGWAATLSETYGFKPLYFAIIQAGRLSSLLPVMEADSWLTGRRGVSLPFTDHVPPLVSDPAAFSELFNAALCLGCSRGWRTLECRGGADWLPDTPPSLTFYRHTLALSAKADWLFSRFESSVRRAIRKAERNGVVVEASSRPEAIATYYTLHCRTRQKHGLPPQPFSFFRNLQRHVIAPGGGQVFLARHQDVPLAGAVFLHSGSQVVYKFAASDESGLHLRPNDRLIWEAIQWYGNHGFTTLDFGRTSLANEGLRRFKLGWGTTETTIGYLKYDLRQDAFVTDHDRAAGWYNRVFSRLPTPVLRCLGQLVYPHLA